MVHGVTESDKTELLSTSKQTKRDLVTRLGTLLVSARAGTPTQVYLTLKTLLLATMLRYITLFYKRKKMKPESLSGLLKDTKR